MSSSIWYGEGGYFLGKDASESCLKDLHAKEKRNFLLKDNDVWGGKVLLETQDHSRAGGRGLRGLQSSILPAAELSSTLAKGGCVLETPWTDILQLYEDPSQSCNTLLGKESFSCADEGCIHPTYS